jgi:hypothetical protein
LPLIYLSISAKMVSMSEWLSSREVLLVIVSVILADIGFPLLTPTLVAHDAAIRTVPGSFRGYLAANGAPPSDGRLTQISPPITPDTLRPRRNTLPGSLFALSCGWPLKLIQRI